MSSTVDANILVYASNTADPAHSQARMLLERLAAGPDLFYLFWPAALGYLRIVTHPTLLPRPLKPVQAAENLNALVSRPHVRTPGEAEGFWALFRDTSGDQARGNEIPDVHLATLMRQHGVRRIYSRDRGFWRHPGIDAVDPFVTAEGRGPRPTG